MWYQKAKKRKSRSVSVASAGVEKRQAQQIVARDYPVETQVERVVSGASW
jgi:hypothetical protein